MRAFVLAGFLFAAAFPAARCDPPAETRSAVVVLPGPDGIVDVAGADRGEEAAANSNPFRRQYRAPEKSRDVPVRIEAVVCGGRPGSEAVVINGETYSPGERFEGMEVASIGSDTVELRRGRTLAKLPFRDAPLLLRLNP